MPFPTNGEFSQSSFVTFCASHTISALDTYERQSISTGVAVAETMTTARKLHAIEYKRVVPPFGRRLIVICLGSEQMCSQTPTTNDTEARHNRSKALQASKAL
jgi:hypothetical protein